MGVYKEKVIQKMDETGCSGRCDKCADVTECHASIEKAAEEDSFQRMIQMQGGCPYGGRCDY